MQTKIVVAVAMASAWLAGFLAGREHQRDLMRKNLKAKLPLIEQRMNETFRIYMQAELDRTRRANAERRAKTWLN